MFYIDFNGHKNTDYGFMVAHRPSVPAPALRGEYAQIAGRDGALLITDGTYENIEISVEMNYVSHPNKQGEAFRRAKAWLRGGGPLVFSDDGDVYYKVKAAGITDNQRRHIVGSDMIATFICDPYTYMRSGTVPIGPSNIYNPYDTSHPVYEITGEGLCTLEVNGKTVTANVGQNLTIDTDLLIAFRSDGTLHNADVTGDYNDLWLVNGYNEISISSGFGLSVIPNWRVL